MKVCTFIVAQIFCSMAFAATRTAMPPLTQEICAAFNVPTNPQDFPLQRWKINYSTVDARGNTNEAV